MASSLLLPLSMSHSFIPPILVQVPRMLVGLPAVILFFAEASAAFPARLQVGNAKESVELACNASPGQLVSWKVDKPWVKMTLLGPGNHHLFIADLDISSAGNYTCWSGPFLLSSTLLAVRDPALPLFGRKVGQGVAEVSCEAESYNGTFSCSWEALHPATFRVHVHRRGQAPGVCPAREVTAPPGPVSLPLQDCSFCPFGEPRKVLLQVTLEGVGEDGNYQELTTTIFLPDIVRPASPDRLVAHRQSGHLNLSWTPPASWPQPSAYFSLHYHLRLQPFGKDVSTEVWSDQLQETRQEEEGRLVRRVQIRCRDPFLRSAWSAWSAWVPVQ